MEAFLYGLTVTDVRHLAFEMAGISHPFNVETNRAGKDRIDGLLHRHQDFLYEAPLVPVPA